MSLIISGKVVGGKRRGRRLGFPTINIAVPRSIKKDHWGIYFSLVKIGDTIYPGATHLGPLKTFLLRKVTCETFLLTLSNKDLYGQKVEKRLLFKFRDVEHFPTIAHLRKQMKKDIIAAKKFFGL